MLHALETLYINLVERINILGVGISYSLRLVFTDWKCCSSLHPFVFVHMEVSVFPVLYALCSQTGNIAHLCIPLWFLTRRNFYCRCYVLADIFPQQRRHKWCSALPQDTTSRQCSSRSWQRWLHQWMYIVILALHISVREGSEWIYARSSIRCDINISRCNIFLLIAKVHLASSNRCFVFSAVCSADRVCSCSSIRSHMSTF